MADHIDNVSEKIVATVAVVALIDSADPGIEDETVADSSNREIVGTVLQNASDSAVVGQIGSAASAPVPLLLAAPLVAAPSFH